MGSSRNRDGVVIRWKALTREQKLSVGVLGVLGVISLLFAFIQVRRALITPFTTPVQRLVELKKLFGPSQEELMEEEKKKDTDGDGLSDYDERKVYRTSPYLRDSDSDGEPDNIEIAKGTDPNCPKGETCAAAIAGTEVATGTGPGIVPPSAQTQGLVPGVSPLMPERDPAAIREFLRQSGVSEAELSNYTDADLLQAYDESSAQFGAGDAPEDSQTMPNPSP